MYACRIVTGTVGRRLGACMCLCVCVYMHTCKCAETHIGRSETKTDRESGPNTKLLLFKYTRVGAQMTRHGVRNDTHHSTLQTWRVSPYFQCGITDLLHCKVLPLKIQHKLLTVTKFGRAAWQSPAPLTLRISTC
jgi:hypothetical protein